MLSGPGEVSDGRQERRSTISSGEHRRSGGHGKSGGEGGSTGSGGQDLLRQLEKKQLRDSALDSGDEARVPL